MQIDPRKLRILFVDDEELEVPKTLAQQGYDVVHWRDVENLDRLCDGRYQVIFLDVRGVGANLGGNGLDILKYVAEHNPLIYVVIFSAKPFTGAEAEIIRKFAQRSVAKDCTVYDIIDILEQYSKTLSEKYLLKSLESRFPIGFFAKRNLKRGIALTESQIEQISKASSVGADAAKILSNTSTIAITLIKLLNGLP